jgi:hypothetical protein
MKQVQVRRNTSYGNKLKIAERKESLSTRAGKISKLQENNKKYSSTYCGVNERSENKR